VDRKGFSFQICDPNPRLKKIFYERGDLFWLFDN